MLIKCAECGSDISDKASSCPHCGAPVPSQTAGPQEKHQEQEPPPAPPKENAPRRIPVEEEDDFVSPSLYSSEPQRSFDAANAFIATVKVLFFLLAVLIICGAVCFFLLRGDVGGIATKLRAVAESDSGDGSHIDRSGSRMFFKFHLAAFLDAVQGVEPSRKKPEPVIKQDPPSDPQSDSLPKPKTERKPLELPPPPPEQI